eukprot:scaffold40074_cov161-Skeletonema_marinoi.AAC.2
MYPSQKVGFVDVRDVSKAHLEGLLRDEANDKRFILCAESPELVEFVRPLEAKFGKDSMVMRLWNPEMAELYKAWGKGVLCDGSRAAEILGIEYIGLEKCMVEMADSMISTGCIEDKRTTKAA